MASGDGNGWVLPPDGGRFWGRHGAAGLLLVSDGTGEDGAPVGSAPHALMQLRAAWTHLGGTWGLPGGAVDSHEGVVGAALREAQEETGLDPSAVEVLGCRVTAKHPPWSYTVVLGRRRADAPVQRPRVRTAESEDVRWVRLEDVVALPLHPGLATTWADLLPWARTTTR